MFRITVFSIAFSLISLAGLYAAGGGVPGPAVERGFGCLPLCFIENQGQIDNDDVAFYVKGADRTLYFTSEGITFALSGKPGAEPRRWTARLRFAGADPGVRPEGQERQSTVFSYFKGKRADWKTGLPAFSRIVYRDLWPGVDLACSVAANGLKYEFVVAPGADPSQVRLAYEGVTGLVVTECGELEVQTGGGAFKDERPYAYQMVEGTRQEVSMRYALLDDHEEGAFSYGFALGAFDPDKPLVLDPVVLVYCGYIGGAGDDSGYAMALDGEGRVYVTGSTNSTAITFPATVGPDLSYNGGSNDVFVARVNAQGTGLDYCGYIGGDGDESGEGIAVDSLGRAYVAGSTTSSETTFPVTVGPDLTYNGGSKDAFIARVNAQGTGLDYCGYIGGDDWEICTDIAVTAQGVAFVSGHTTTTEASFPVAVGPDLSFAGVFDAFVARVNAAGTGLDYCGYIGGDDIDFCWAIAVDGQGRASVAGDTCSDEATFPVIVGPDLTYNGGSYDVFAARVNAAGTGLDYCGYIGGSDVDYADDIAVESQGAAYMTGSTASTEATFPVIVGPDLTHNGSTDAFVARVNAQGTGLGLCGYIGGDSFDAGNGLAVDSQRDIYVTGSTASSEASFPVISGPDLTYNGGSWDAFVGRVGNQGKTLDYCGYIGGSAEEVGNGIALDGDGNAYAAGWTLSSQTTFPETVGPDLTYNGGRDVFVAKVEGPDEPILADVKANGSAGPLTIAQGTNLKVEVTLWPGDHAGTNADWWVLLSAPSGWYRYRVSTHSWVSGFGVTRQGPLVPVGPQAVYNGAGLPVGVFIFYFGVDTVMNGVFDSAEAVYDSVEVTVQ